MANTTRLLFTYLVQNQAGAEIVYNGALNELDVLVAARVINQTTAAPPGSPAAGDAYLVATGGSGAWAGADGRIAYYYGGWFFVTPVKGMAFWDEALGARFDYDGTNWQSPSAVKAVTTTYAVTLADSLVTVDAAGGAFTATLPAATAAGVKGKEFTFKRMNTGANLPTISGGGTNIDGAATYTGLSAQYKYLRVKSNGTIWLIIASN